MEYGKRTRRRNHFLSRKQSRRKQPDAEGHSRCNTAFFLISIGDFTAQQVRRIFNIFGPAQCLILLNEDLKTNHRETMSKVFDFLGVDASFVPPAAKVFEQNYKQPLKRELSEKLTEIFYFDIKELERLIGTRFIPVVFALKTTALPQGLVEGTNLPLPILSAFIGVVILFFGRRIFWLCVAAVGLRRRRTGAAHRARADSSPRPDHCHCARLYRRSPRPVPAKDRHRSRGIPRRRKARRCHRGSFFRPIGSVLRAHFHHRRLWAPLLLLMLFDWPLISLSAAVGAHLIQSAIVLPATGNAILFVVLVLIGVLVQAGALRRSRAVVAD